MLFNQPSPFTTMDGLFVFIQKHYICVYLKTKMAYNNSENLSIIPIEDIGQIYLGGGEGRKYTLKWFEPNTILSITQAAHLARNSTAAINNVCYRKGLDVTYPFIVAPEGGLIGEKCIVNNAKWRKYVLKARKRNKVKQ